MRDLRDTASGSEEQILEYLTGSLPVNKYSKHILRHVLPGRYTRRIRTERAGQRGIGDDFL